MTYHPEEAARAFRSSKGWISVWVAYFVDDDAADEYIDSGKFERDQGYKIIHGLEPFKVFVGTKSINDALFEFGYKKGLVERIGKTIKSIEMNKKPNTIIIEDHFKYDRSKVKTKSPIHVCFIGVFRNKSVAQ